MIDSHCHLNFPAIKADIKNVIKRSKASGVTKLLTINTNPNDFDDHFNLIKEYENIYIAYGIHPEEVKDNSYLSLDDIENKIKNSLDILNRSPKQKELMLHIISIIKSQEYLILKDLKNSIKFSDSSLKSLEQKGFITIKKIKIDRDDRKEENYINGKLDGLVVEWWGDGQLKYEYTYKDDVEINSKYYKQKK